MTIAQDVAQQIYARTSPPPPQHLPEQFLVAVVGERRRRELVRVSRTRQEWVPAAEELPPVGADLRGASCQVVREN